MLSQTLDVGKDERMIGFFRKLLKDRRGNVMVISAAAMPLILGAAGLATDTIQWTLWKRQLQRAADSAALAAVYTRLKTDTQTDVEDAVDHDKDLNLHTWMDLKEDPTVELLSNSGQMRMPVRVTFKIQQRLPFSSFFMSTAPVITAVATAASVPDGGEYCVLATDPATGYSGLTITGSTYLDLGTCSLMANSRHPTRAADNGNTGSGGNGSTVMAASIDAQGGVNASNSWQVSSYHPGTTAVADPFYSLKDSIPTTCNKTASLNKTTGKNGNGGNVDLSSNTASDTVCLSGNQNIDGTVKLGSATYIVDSGSLTMNQSSASLTCNGCTIIMTSFTDPVNNTGSVNLTGGSVSLSPPRQTFDSSGVANGTIGNQTWKGIVLYQDPRAKDNGSTTTAQNKIRGNSDLSFQGAVYFGNQMLEYVGGGKDVAACLQVVAKRVIFSGNSKIKAASTCGAFGLGAVGGGRRVRLVS